MANSTSFIFLGETLEETATISRLVGKRFPLEIPKKFIRYIDIKSGSKTVRLLGEELKKNLNLADTKSLFQMFNIGPVVHTVNIILNLPLIEQSIKDESEKIFSNVFLT